MSGRRGRTRFTREWDTEPEPEEEKEDINASRPHIELNAQEAMKTVPLDELEASHIPVRKRTRFDGPDPEFKTLVEEAAQRPDYRAPGPLLDPQADAPIPAGKKRTAAHAFLEPLAESVAKRRLSTWTAEPAPPPILSPGETWLAAFNLHQQYQKAQAVVELSYTNFTPRWIASSNHMRDRTRNLGDLRLSKLRHTLAHMGITRSSDQEQFHEAFIQACLAKIYGKDWVSSSQRALKLMRIKSIRYEVMVMTPR